MSSFIKNMVSRHLAATPTVLPRLRGRFEDVEPMANQARNQDGLGATDIMSESPDSGNNSDLNRVTASKGVIQHSVQNQSDAADSESKKDDESSFESTTANGITNENRATKFPENGKSDSNKSEFIRYTESVERPGRGGPVVEGLFTNDYPSELSSDKQDYKNFLSGHPTANEPDFSVVENPGFSEFTTGHEIGNFHVDISKKSMEKSAIPPSTMTKDKVLIEPGQNGSSTNIKPLYEPVFKSHEQPIIKVTIGRINIQAEVKKTSPQIRTKQPEAKPRMSLNDYLKKQNDPTR